MNEENKELLEKEITRVSEKLNTLTPGTEEYSAVSKNLTELSKIASENRKITQDYEATVEERKQNEQLKRDQMSEQQKDRKQKWFLDLILGLGPSVLFLASQLKCMQAENRGEPYFSKVLAALTSHFPMRRK